MSKRIKDIDFERDSKGNIPNHQSNVIKVKDLLNSTGHGFCLAKFRQVTLHLGTGLVHSCHHPSAHKIDIDQVGEDATVLFNTPKLKEARKQMLTGDRPDECDFCWRVEDSGKASNTDLLSDRYLKSSEPWALDDHDTIVEYTGDEHIYPSYLEVDFSNACNLRCTYCGPEYSSKWVEDLKHKGPIKLLDDTPHKRWSHGWQDLDSLVYANKDHNPYIDAFWKWFPDAYPHLKTYRITGGEPLLSKQTFKSLDWLIENPNDELEFAINTNLMVPQKIWDKFLDKLAAVRDNKSVAKITVFTSVDAWGKRAEYARTGLDFELFRERFEQLVAMKDIRGVIMVTFNIFSVTSFKPLLEWVLELKRKHNPNKHIEFIEKETGFIIPDTGEPFMERSQHNGNDTSHSYLVGIDMPYLRSPEFLDARLLTNDIVNEYWVPSMSFIAENNSSNAWSMHQGFEDHEYEKFYRTLVHRMYRNKKHDDSNPDFDTTLNRAMFYDFVNTKDARDGTNFLETFPEMTDFYNLCKECASNIIAKS